MQHNSLSIPDLILGADIFVQLIMLLLIIASIVSWAIIFSKKTQLTKHHLALKKFKKGFNTQAATENVFNVNDTNPNTAMFKVAKEEFERGDKHHSERAEKVLHMCIEEKVEKLETRLPILAIIGSASPYIGLLGTVWGIMHSFIGLASVKQATIAIVAPGIAEALIATAFGLFAAIPASIFHNKLTAEIDLAYAEYHRIAGEYITVLNRS